MVGLETIGFTMICIGSALIITSLVLTVVWKVPSLIDELSGRKAKRQIERMKKLNIASSSLTAMNTAEFYKSMRDEVPLSRKEGIPISESVTNTSELSKLVDDPYNTVGSGAVVPVVDQPEQGYPLDDEAVTDIFDDSDVQDVPVNKVFDIQIVVEQSSLDLK